MQNKVTLKAVRTYRTPGMGAEHAARVRMAAAVRKDERVGYIRITTWVRGIGIVNDQYKSFDNRDAANAFWLEADELLAQHFICE